MNYYNEIDAYAAQWLRNLIAAGHIPKGEVDERSIVDVMPGDLKGYTQCHFFAGIGGWPLALRLASWPESRPVWTGSCPCQPFSAAGKRKGGADERHLWPEFARLIGQCKPSIVFGEQVASKLGRGWLSGVFADLEAMGYAAAGADLCAAGVGAPHIRQRLWWVADLDGGVADAECRTAERHGHEMAGATQEIGGEIREQRFRDDIGNGGATDRVADASTVRSERGAPAGREAVRGSEHSGGLGDANDPGPQDGRVGRDKQPIPQGRQDAQRSVGLSGGDSGLQHAASDGRQQGWPESVGREFAERCGEDSGMEHADKQRFDREGLHLQPGGQEQTQVGEYWSSEIWIPCADGKARRIEPGIEPLVNGVPNRVGRLRAYGNAIVPQVAAEFVRACT